MNEPKVSQEKSSEWVQQWNMFQDDELFLFKEWIEPVQLEDFEGQEVLEGGCGGGQHTGMVGRFAKSVTAVDLNTIELAKSRNINLDNLNYVEDDLATMQLGRQFDVVFSIGVIHHTDNPDATFENLYQHCRPGGRIIIWCYSTEGNFLARYFVEIPRKIFLRYLPKRTLKLLSQVISGLMYPIVHSIYRFNIFKFLPYFEYFGNFRRLSFERNVLNVFDKLNAPQTDFISRKRCEQWLSKDRFEENSISIRHYKNVSYSLTGIKQNDSEHSIPDECLLDDVKATSRP